MCRHATAANVVPQFGSKTVDLELTGQRKLLASEDSEEAPDSSGNTTTQRHSESFVRNCANRDSHLFVYEIAVGIIINWGSC